MVIVLFVNYCTKLIRVIGGLNASQSIIMLYFLCYGLNPLKVEVIFLIYLLLLFMLQHFIQIFLVTIEHCNEMSGSMTSLC